MCKHTDNSPRVSYTDDDAWFEQAKRSRDRWLRENPWRDDVSKPVGNGVSAIIMVLAIAILLSAGIAIIRWILGAW